MVFKYDNVDNPFVNGLVLFKGKLEETDYPRLKQIIEKYDFLYESQKKKQIYEEQYLQQRSNARLKHKKRNDNLVLLEEYDDIFFEEELQVSRSKEILLVVLLAISLYLIKFMFDVYKHMKELDDQEKKAN